MPLTCNQEFILTWTLPEYGSTQISKRSGSDNFRVVIESSSTSPPVAFGLSRGALVCLQGMFKAALESA